MYGVSDATYLIFLVYKNIGLFFYKENKIKNLIRGVDLFEKIYVEQKGF